MGARLMTEKRLYPEYTKHYPLLVKNFMKRPLDLYPDDIALHIDCGNKGFHQKCDI